LLKEKEKIMGGALTALLLLSAVLALATGVTGYIIWGSRDS